MMGEKEFLEVVEREVKQNPRLLGQLFKLVSDQWNAMVEAQRNERESTHRQALAEMLNNLWALTLYKKKNPRLFTNFECCTILDAVDAVDPKCGGGSSAMNELLAHLAASFRALGWTPECDFIRDIRKKSEMVKNLYRNFPEEP